MDNCSTTKGESDENACEGHGEREFSFFPFWYVIKVVLETRQEALSLFKRIETEKEREKKGKEQETKRKIALPTIPLRFKPTLDLLLQFVAPTSHKPISHNIEEYI